MKKNILAKQITMKMKTMFKDFDGEYLYNKIISAKIYLADIPNRFTNVNYIVSTNAIYIRGEENIKNIDEIMFHEIFH